MNQKNSIRMIVFGGLFIALSVALSRLASITVPIASVPGVRLSFGLVPVIIAGVLFGPGVGFMVGVLSDFIGMILFPLGPYFPGFTLTYGLAGAIPSFFVSDIVIRREESSQGRRFFHIYYALNWNKCKTIYRLLGGVALSQLINSVGLNTLWVSVLYGKAFMAMLPARLLTQAILIPCFTFVSYTTVLVYREVFHGQTPCLDISIPSQQ